MNVDFRLASTYFPIFVCLIKCLVLAVLGFYGMRKGFFMFVAGLLQLDRMFFNIDFIIDTNQILYGWLFFTFACEERSLFGFHTNGMHLIAIVWALLPFVNMSMKVETTTYILCFMCICCTFMGLETLLWQLARCIMFVAYIATSMYVSFYKVSAKPQMQVLFSAGVIICGHVIIATFFFVVATSFSVYSIYQKQDAVADLEAQAVRQALAARRNNDAKS